MRKPADNSVKVWSREYEEKPFFFVKDSSELGRRLIAWSEEPEQIKKAFYGVLESFPQTVAILLKISAGKDDAGNNLWSRFYGEVEKTNAIQIIQKNEIYVFSDGMHQLCIKIPKTKRYLAFDEHGVFFVYSPSQSDEVIFQLRGFERRSAEPIWGTNYLIHRPPNTESLEMKFKTELGLQKVKSDLD